MYVFLIAFVIGASFKLIGIEIKSVYECQFSVKDGINNILSVGIVKPYLFV